MCVAVIIRDADEMSDLSDDMSLEGIDDTDSGHKEASVEVDAEEQTEASTADVEDKTLMLPVSTEVEETDPKFIVRPSDLTCVEGESVTFECQVTGTEPVGGYFKVIYLVVGVSLILVMSGNLSVISELELKYLFSYFLGHVRIVSD